MIFPHTKGEEYSRDLGKNSSFLAGMTPSTREKPVVVAAPVVQKRPGQLSRISGGDFIGSLTGNIKVNDMKPALFHAFGNLG